MRRSFWSWLLSRGSHVAGRGPTAERLALVFQQTQALGMKLPSVIGLSRKKAIWLTVAQPWEYRARLPSRLAPTSLSEPPGKSARGVGDMPLRDPLTAPASTSYGLQPVQSFSLNG